MVNGQTDSSASGCSLIGFHTILRQLVTAQWPEQQNFERAKSYVACQAPARVTEWGVQPPAVKFAWASLWRVLRHSVAQGTECRHTRPGSADGGLVPWGWLELRRRCTGPPQAYRDSAVARGRVYRPRAAGAAATDRKLAVGASRAAVSSHRARSIGASRRSVVINCVPSSRRITSRPDLACSVSKFCWKGGPGTVM
jgi:hypothetical protein